MRPESFLTLVGTDFCEENALIQGAAMLLIGSACSVRPYSTTETNRVIGREKRKVKLFAAGSAGGIANANLGVFVSEWLQLPALARYQAALSVDASNF
jgi:hypothetical protein